MIYIVISFFLARFAGIQIRGQATYNWPCEKHSFSRLIPQTLSDCPWDLFIDIANLSRTGKCNRLKFNGMSIGIKGIRGIKTSLPLYFSFKILASMTLFINFFTASRVPLQRRCWFIFRNIMITDPIFNCRLWGGNPGYSSEFKNSVRYLTLSSWLVMESIDLYLNLKIHFVDINVFIQPIYLFRSTIHDLCNFEQCLGKPSRWVWSLFQ